MKRKPRFFIGFVAAIITFGSLVAFVGHRHHGHHGHSCHRAGYEHYQKDCHKELKEEKTPNQKTDSTSNQ
jgi:hypothetical protein